MNPEVVTIDDSDSEIVTLGDSSDEEINMSTTTSPPSNSITEVPNETPSSISESNHNNNNQVTLNDSLQASGSVQTDSSFEDYEYNLKLYLYGDFKQFKTTWRTKLSVALKDVLSDLAKSGKSLVVTKRDGVAPLSLDGTPYSLNLNSGTILKAIPVGPPQHTSKTSSGTTKQPLDPNVITLKLQDGQRKHLKEFQIAKQAPLSLLKEKYAKEFNIDLNRMTLRFDGDTVDDQDTPDSLDIEDECVIDVIVST